MKTNGQNEDSFPSIPRSDAFPDPGLPGVFSPFVNHAPDHTSSRGCTCPALSICDDTLAGKLALFLARAGPPLGGVAFIGATSFTAH